MKKGLLLGLTAVLLLVFCAFACAEETEAVKDADLFDLWDYSSESPVWVCSAVPITDGIAIVSPAALPDNTEYLVVTDGKNQWEAKAVLPDADNLLTLVFFDPSATPARYSAWPLMPYGEGAGVSSCYIRHGDAMGSRINRAVLNAEKTSWKGRNCYLLTVSDPVPVGSPLLTADGQLAAIVAAEWAEGTNRVLALPPEEIAGSLTEVARHVDYLPNWGDEPEGLIVTITGNQATIDWKEMTLPEKKAGEKIYLILADAGNQYLNYYPAETKERSLTVLLTPGRLYVAGLLVSAGIPDALPEHFTAFSAQPVKKLTEYDFRPVVTAVAVAPEGGLKAGEDPVPVSQVTREMIRSKRVYFYSHCTYKVKQEIRDRTLLVTITDPDGNNYKWESGWIYSPDYMEKDIWYVSFSDSGLDEVMISNNYAAGTYRMAFYVDGKLADSFEFELK